MQPASSTSRTASSIELDATNWKEWANDRSLRFDARIISPNRAWAFYFNGNEPASVLGELIKKDMSITSEELPYIVMSGKVFSCSEQQQNLLQSKGIASRLTPTMGDLHKERSQDTVAFAVFPTEPTYSIRKPGQSN